MFAAKEAAMSSILQVLCCVVVMAFWFGPLALLLFCGVFHGWCKCADLVRGQQEP